MGDNFQTHVEILKMLQAQGAIPPHIDVEAEARKRFPLDDNTPFDVYHIDFIIEHTYWHGGEYRVKAVLFEADKAIENFSFGETETGGSECFVKSGRVTLGTKRIPNEECLELLKHIVSSELEV